MSVGLIAGSLLAVVAGDDFVTQGQIHLSQLQSAIGAAQATQKSEQATVAQMAAPTRVVHLAEAEGGLVAAGQVIDLPQVPLDVPLPAPQTGPAVTSTGR